MSPHSTPKILVNNATLAAPALKLLQARGIVPIHVPITASPEELREIVGREAVDAIISRAVRITAETIAASPRLKVIAKHGVGVDNIDVAAATKAGVPILFSRGANARSVAEHALGFMLVLTKRLGALDDDLRGGRWTRADHMGAEISGKTIGLVGFGNVGRDLAKLASAFGMAVLGYDPYVAARDFPPHARKVETLDEILETADFVSLHCPLTRDTKGMIGARELARMKRSAIFLNTARGPVVDETALLAALRDGTIRGAGLDTYLEEPPSQPNPLWSLPNVIATPHTAGTTQEAFERVATLAVENVFAVLDGKIPDRDYCANPEVLRSPNR